MTEHGETAGVLSEEQFREVRRNLSWAISSESTAKAMRLLLDSHRALTAQIAAKDATIAELNDHLTECVGERENLRGGWKADYEAVAALKADRAAAED